MGVTTSRRSVVRIADGRAVTRTDAISVESPLTVVLAGEVIVTTMRTPGHDLELAAGWLVNESGVRSSADIVTMGAYATITDTDGVDAVRATLAAGITPPRPRAFVTTAACGVCSADVLAAVRAPDGPLHTDGWTLPSTAIGSLLGRMRADQRMFEQTGSLHAAGLASPAHELLWVREDVGRHNAVDKTVGRALFDDLLPLADHTLVVSGRVSYEIVHKALTAGIGAIVAVSGPTSLAVDLARLHGVVLVGFVRDGRMNVYSGADRVTPGAAA